jgi:hypothetical protein
LLGGGETLDIKLMHNQGLSVRVLSPEVEVRALKTYEILAEVSSR